MKLKQNLITLITLFGLRFSFIPSVVTAQIIPERTLGRESWRVMRDGFRRNRINGCARRGSLLPTVSSLVLPLIGGRSACVRASVVWGERHYLGFLMAAIVA